MIVGLLIAIGNAIAAHKKSPGGGAGAPNGRGKGGTTGNTGGCIDRRHSRACGNDGSRDDAQGATKLPITLTLLKSATPTTRMYQVPAAGVLTTTDSELPGFTDL